MKPFHFFSTRLKAPGPDSSFTCNPCVRACLMKPFRFFSTRLKAPSLNSSFTYPCVRACLMNPFRFFSTRLKAPSLNSSFTYPCVRACLKKLFRFFSTRLKGPGRDSSFTYPCIRACLTKPFRFFRTRLKAPGRDSSASTAPPTTTHAAWPGVSRIHSKLFRLTEHIPGVEIIIRFWKIAFWKHIFWPHDLLMQSMETVWTSLVEVNVSDEMFKWKCWHIRQTNQSQYLTLGRDNNKVTVKGIPM